MTYEVDWLKKNLTKLFDASVRKELVNMNNEKLTVQRQAELLSLNRTSLYRKPALKLITDDVSSHDVWRRDFSPTLT